MKNFRCTFYIFCRQLVSSTFSKRAIAGYLVGIVSILMTSRNYSNFTGDHTLNFAEVFIQHYQSIGGLTVTLFGLLLVLSEAPFIHSDAFMLLHRVGRKPWYKAMWGYIIAQTLIYGMISLLASMIFVLPKVYIQNIWSSPLRNLSNASKAAATERYSINIQDDAFLGLFTPYTAFIHAFMLMALYGILLGGILFALNLYTHTAIGTIAAGAVHLFGYLTRDILNYYIPGIRKWSLLDNALLLDRESGELPLLFSYVLFAFLIIIIHDVGNIFIKHTEFYGIGDDSDA